MKNKNVILVGGKEEVSLKKLTRKILNEEIRESGEEKCHKCGNTSYTKALFTGTEICQRCGAAWHFLPERT